MKVIVGLGNPGKKYQQTRHNIGFICLDYFARNQGEKFKYQKKFQAEIVKTEQYILVKPQTYMNLSGISVKAVLDYYQIPITELIVVFDDLDLPFAKLRLRYLGGDGGHKGIRSISSSIQTNEFKRIKFGIDKHPDIDAKDYVLSTFHLSEKEALESSVDRVKNILIDFVQGMNFLQSMNTYY